MTLQDQMRLKMLSKLYDVKCEQLRRQKQPGNAWRNLILQAEADAIKAELVAGATLSSVSPL